jgi:uncharacterized protein (TIGR00159 family)
MEALFINIRVLDIIDILLVAFLMYQVYMLFRGTVAINILIGIFAIYLFWLIVKALNMQMLGSILGQIIGVGVLALIIVFQQEIRRFLVILGTRYFSKNFTLDNLFSWNLNSTPTVKIKSIITACQRMSKTKTGALMVIEKKSSLSGYGETGDIINANTSSRLLESIFYKNSPLHDGAVIIRYEKIYAARCILPVSENPDIPAKYGLRHRAALGMTESNDSLVIIVSEETGEISYSENGVLFPRVKHEALLHKLENEFSELNEGGSG